MKNYFRYLALISVVFCVGCASRLEYAFPADQADLCIYICYPFHGPKWESHGRPGSGVEFFFRGDWAEVIVYPNFSDPYRVVAGDSSFREFMERWQKLEIFEIDPARFDVSRVEDIDNENTTILLMPFDDRTLILKDRSRGEVEIYAPDFVIENSTDPEVSWEVAAVLSLLYEIVAESVL